MSPSLYVGTEAADYRRTTFRVRVHRAILVRSCHVAFSLFYVRECRISRRSRRDFGVPKGYFRVYAVVDARRRSLGTFYGHRRGDAHRRVSCSNSDIFWYAYIHITYIHIHIYIYIHIPRKKGREILPRRVALFAWTEGFCKPKLSGGGRTARFFSRIDISIGGSRYDDDDRRRRRFFVVINVRESCQRENANGFLSTIVDSLGLMPDAFNA